DRTTESEAVSVQRHGPGEDRDDRERQREVAERAHSASQLLRVAEPAELRLVVEHGASYSISPIFTHASCTADSVSPPRSCAAEMVASAASRKSADECR